MTNEQSAVWLGQITEAVRAATDAAEMDMLRRLNLPPVPTPEHIEMGWYGCDVRKCSPETNPEHWETVNKPVRELIEFAGLRDLIRRLEGDNLRLAPVRAK